MSNGLPVPPGTVVGGKYRVERLIGAGGMGIVLEATHVALGQGVALKALRSTVIGSAEAQRRFMREARATFALKSPHTVRLLDVDEIEPLGLVMVMELLRGKTLRQVILDRAPLPIDEAVLYTRQICRALAEAHRLGIVHRDIKPSNVFVSEFEGKPWIKVLDFGLSKLLEGEALSAPLTAPATTLGTPRYMAPEQWSNPSAVDPRSDLYSLGTVLYQMLTNTVPFGDVPADERRARMMIAPAPSPRSLRAEVPESLARVVMRLLRPVPDERFADAEAVEAALDEAPVSASVEETITTSVGKGRSQLPTVPESGDAPPTTEREPGWDVETTPKAQKPQIEVNVFTGAKIHAPRESKPPSTLPAPSTAAPFALTTELVPAPQRARGLADTLKSEEAMSPLSPSLGGGDVKIVAAPPPGPAIAVTPAPSPAPAITDIDPARFATTGRVKPRAKPPTVRRTFVVAVIVAFALGVALAFLVYARV